MILGSDLVDWLISRVGGFADRRDAKKYACRILKGLISQNLLNNLLNLLNNLHANFTSTSPPPSLPSPLTLSLPNTAGYIRHTVNKLNFSEQCYYVFGDLRSNSQSTLFQRQPMNSVTNRMYHFVYNFYIIPLRYIYILIVYVLYVVFL